MKLKTLLLLLFILPFSINSFSQDLHRDLLIYYPLDGNAIDYSGHGNDGVNNAITTTDRTNTAGKAMAFNGVDTYIDLPGNPELKPSFPFSVSFWVYFEEGATYIMTTDFAIDNHSGVWFNRMLDKRFSMSVGNAGGNTSPSQRSSFDTDYVMEDKTWYHVAAVWYNAIDAEVYINAFLRETFNSGTAQEMGYTNANGTIGRMDRNVISEPEYFEGKIDEFYMWKRALTQEDVNELFYGSGLSKTDNINFIQGALTLSPNPTTDLIYLKSTDNFQLQGIQIFDTSGKLMLVSNENGYNISLDVSNLPSGTYFIKMLGYNQSKHPVFSTGTFVKQ
ncbi:MAG: T9SS type A sorting domain-containing protein [Saprospiraceae bacterium]|nr:T9SS type A sorting domain-containing protein [Saprospiraceae bacterium]